MQLTYSLGYCTYLNKINVYPFTRNLTALKKEVLKLERELMQQKSRNKVLYPFSVYYF